MFLKCTDHECSKMQSSHLPPALTVPDTAQCLLGREQMPSKASTHHSDASSASAARPETAAGLCCAARGHLPAAGCLCTPVAE